MSGKELSNEKTIKFLMKYRECLEKEKANLTDEDSQKVSEILHTMIDEINLIKIALESTPSSYNFIWILFKYTIGVPKLLSDRHVKYDVNLDVNQNFSKIYTSLTENILIESNEIREHHLLCLIIEIIGLSLIMVSNVLLNMTKADSIYALFALLPLYPVLAPYLICLIVPGLAAILLIFIYTINILSIEDKYTNLLVFHRENAASGNLFFKSSNDSDAMSQVKNKINSSYCKEFVKYS